MGLVLESERRPEEAERALQDATGPTTFPKLSNTVIYIYQNHCK
jgi:hypothetical protein